MSTQNQNDMKTSVTYGVIGGLVAVLINLIVYLVNFEWLLSGWLTFFVFLIYVVALVLSGLVLRRQNDGYLSFGNAFVGVFVTGLTFSVVTTLWGILLFNVIDTQAAEILGDIAIDNAMEITKKMLDAFNVPEDEAKKILKEAYAEAQKNQGDSFSVASQLTGLFSKIVGGVIASLIIGLIIKKNPPIALEQS